MAPREPLTLTELQITADVARADQWESVVREPMPPARWMSAEPGQEEGDPSALSLEALLYPHIGPTQLYAGYDRALLERKLGDLLVYVAQWASYHDVALDAAVWAALVRLDGDEPQPGEAVAP